MLLFLRMEEYLVDLIHAVKEVTEKVENIKVGIQCNLFLGWMSSLVFV